MLKSNLITPSEVLLVVARSSPQNEVKGRTRIQKLVYFLAQRRAIPVTYTPYYYGPYSEEVTASLDSLVARGLLSEEIEYLNNTEGPFEGRLYRYQLTPDGIEVAESLLEQRQDLRALSDDVRRILDLNPTTTTLALASKLHYIERELGDALKALDLTEKAKQFGWDIDPSQIEQAVEFLQKVE